MRIIEQSGHSWQGPSADSEDFFPSFKNPFLREFSEKLPHDLPNNASHDLAHVLAVAKIRHREHFYCRRNSCAPDFVEDLRRWVLRRTESLAEWVNRNRPAGAPRVAGEPGRSDEDELWGWEPTGWPEQRRAPGCHLAAAEDMFPIHPQPMGRAHHRRRRLGPGGGLIGPRTLMAVG